MMIVKCILPEKVKISIGQEALITDEKSSFVKKMVMDDKFFDAFVQATMVQSKGRARYAFLLAEQKSDGVLEFHGTAPWQDW
jgi:hypothetical protein